MTLLEYYGILGNFIPKNNRIGFYLDLGFEEIITSEKMPYFSIGKFWVYSQDYYAKGWVDNSRFSLELDTLESNLKHVQNLGLTEKYENVRLSEIKYNEWGNEFLEYSIDEFRKE